jgi:hypothetical protein
MTVPAPAATEKPPSVWEDLIDIWYAPAQVFRRRINGQFGIPLLIFTVATLALFLATKPALEPIYDAMAQQQMQAAMAKNPQLTPEMMERGRSFTAVIQPIAVTLAVPISIAILAIVIWLVGKLFDSQATLRSAFVVATFSYAPRLLEWVLNAVQAVLIDPSNLNSLLQLQIGPARFLADASALVVALGLRFGLFVLWSTVLIAIGLRITGKISTGKAVAATAIVWLLGAIPGYFQAMQMVQ